MAKKHTTHVIRRRRPAARRRGGIALFLIGGVIIVALAIGAVAVVKKRSASTIDLSREPQTDVVRQDLVISILQSGELESKNSQTLKNETERTATIVSIVDDGARVKEGDVLFELESQDLLENLLEAQANLSEEEAENNQAEKTIEIAELEYRTDLESANLRVELAEIELRKYMEAEYNQLLAERKSALKLAEAELEQAQKELEDTQKLVEKEYASKRELDTAEIQVQRQEIEVENRRLDVEILENYTREQQIKELENTVTEAKAEVERLKKTRESEIARDEANLAEQRTQLQVAQNRVLQIERQIEKSKAISEWDGLVFYPQQHYRDDRTIEKGASVYARQTLLEYPDLDDWQIKAGVPESIIDRVKPGQRAVASIDALPDMLLEAVVERISIVPDSGRWFERSNTKTYTVTLDIPTTPSVDLKPGMSIMVEIITNKLEDVLQVPLQAVTTTGESRFVYRVVNGKVERTHVRTGESNEKMIEIQAGLKEGDRILLYAPVDQDARAGLKERPLDKADRMGEDAETPQDGEGQEPSESEQPSDEEMRQAPGPDQEGGGRPEGQGAPGGAGQEGQGQRLRRRPEGAGGSGGGSANSGGGEVGAAEGKGSGGGGANRGAGGTGSGTGS